ncbi:MAG TPA: ABC transporter substrate-binding protein [Candidatus Limnocylindrales bacterium]|nr:ABC transporter substrate-binding protein [Candidatus Limnocylindrales bacterium]
MKFSIHLFLFLILMMTTSGLVELGLICLVEAGEEIVILKTNQKIPQYNLPAEAFKKALSYPVREFDIEGDLNKGRKLIEKIKHDKPRLIFAIGDKATFLAKEGFPDVPIIFSMVLNWKKLDLSKNKNITGISLDVPPESQFTHLKLIAPQISRIGVIYSPEASQELIRRAREISSGLGIKLVEVQVTSEKAVKKAWDGIKNQIDALWMVADPIVITQDNFEFLQKQTLQQKIPFLGYSENFVKAGALLSVSPDYETIGSQAASITLQILKDKQKPWDIQVTEPIGTVIVLNKATAKKLGLSLSDSILQLVNRTFE